MAAPLIYNLEIPFAFLRANVRHVCILLNACSLVLLSSFAIGREMEGIQQRRRPPVVLLTSLIASLLSFSRSLFVTIKSFNLQFSLSNFILSVSNFNNQVYNSKFIIVGQKKPGMCVCVCVCGGT